MAYHDLTTRPDVEFLGGNKVRDVIVLSAWTVPHEIYFEARYPAAGWQPSFAKSTAVGYSLTFESLFTLPGVEDVAWTQQETATGFLRDGALIYVQSTSGNSDDNVFVPYSKLGIDSEASSNQPGFVAAIVAALRKKLDAVEGSG
jgi:hypothetical protein